MNNWKNLDFIFIVNIRNFSNCKSKCINFYFNNKISKFKLIKQVNSKII